MPPVIVRTPLSRRKVIALAALAAGAYGAANAGSWLAVPREDAPPAPGAAPVHLAVAVPVGSGQYQPHINGPVLSAIERAIPQVEAGSGGRFTLDVMRVRQPDGAPRPPQAHVVAPLLATGAAPEILTFTETGSPGSAPPELSAAARDLKLFALDGHVTAPAGTVPAALAACRDKGALLAVPLMGSPLVFGYDSLQFQRAGIDPPPANWTWSRVRAAAARLTRAGSPSGPPGGSSGGAEFGFSPWYISSLLLALIWQHGGDVVSADGTRARLAEPAAREAIDLFAGLVRGDGVSPPVTPPFVTYWTEDGILAGGKWWVGMSPAVVTATFSPPLVDSTHLYVKAARAFSALVRGESVYGSGMKAPGGLALTELPSGPAAESRAVPLSVWASLAVNGQARDPALAATALGALAERASELVPLALRRQSPAALHTTLQTFDQRVPFETAVALARSLEDSRPLALDSFERTRRLSALLYNAVVLPLQRGTASAAQVVERATTGIQALLDGP